MTQFVGTTLGTQDYSHTPRFQTAAPRVGCIGIPSSFLSMIAKGWTSKTAWDLLPASLWSVLRQTEYIPNFWEPNLVVFSMDMWNTPLIWAPANYPQAWYCFCRRDLAFPWGSNKPSGSALAAPCAWTVSFLPQPISATTQLCKPRKPRGTAFYCGCVQSCLTTGGSSSLWKYRLLYWVLHMHSQTFI